MLRDGRKIPNLPAKDLVPGDIVEVKNGIKFPMIFDMLGFLPFKTFYAIAFS